MKLTIKQIWKHLGKGKSFKLKHLKYIKLLLKKGDVNHAQYIIKTQVKNNFIIKKHNNKYYIYHPDLEKNPQYYYISNIYTPEWNVWCKQYSNSNSREVKINLLKIEPKKYAETLGIHIATDET